MAVEVWIFSGTTQFIHVRLVKGNTSFSERKIIMSSTISNVADLSNPKEIYVPFVDFVWQEYHLSFENLEGC